MKGGVGGREGKGREGREGTNPVINSHNELKTYIKILKTLVSVVYEIIQNRI